MYSADCSVHFIKRMPAQLLRSPRFDSFLFISLAQRLGLFHSHVNPFTYKDTHTHYTQANTVIDWKKNYTAIFVISWRNYLSFEITRVMLNTIIEWRKKTHTRHQKSACTVQYFHMEYGSHRQRMNKRERNNATEQGGKKWNARRERDKANKQWMESKQLYLVECD